MHKFIAKMLMQSTSGSVLVGPTMVDPSPYLICGTYILLCLVNLATRKMLKKKVMFDFLGQKSNWKLFKIAFIKKKVIIFLKYYFY